MQDEDRVWYAAMGLVRTGAERGNSRGGQSSSTNVGRNSSNISGDRRI